MVFLNRVCASPGNMDTISHFGERTDVSEPLLCTGHCCKHELFDVSRDRDGSRYAALEQEAQDLKKRVWVSYAQQSETRTPKVSF